MNVSLKRHGASLHQALHQIAIGEDEMRPTLFSMIATMGTPLDVSLQNLRLELSFPAGDATAKWFRDTAAR